MKVIDDGLLDTAQHPDAGDEPASYKVARLFKSHAGRLTRLLGGKLRNEADGQDASQEVFLKLWRQEQSGQLRDQATAYMFAAANTVAIDCERRRQVRAHDRAVEIELEELAHPGVPADEAQHWRAGVEALVSCLQELPVRTQQVFILHHFEGLTHTDVAARLGINIRTVERNMAQAHDYCRKRLEDYL